MHTYIQGKFQQGIFLRVIFQHRMMAGCALVVKFVFFSSVCVCVIFEQNMNIFNLIRPVNYI